MKRGYARVSTLDQDLGRQVQALKDYGCEEVYMDKISGTKIQRESLDKMLSDLKPGDTVVVMKVDRLGRSLRHLLALVDEFKARGCDFISLGDNFDTSSAIGRMAMQIVGVFAEFERSMISERTISGLAHVKAMGKTLGPPIKTNNVELLNKVVMMYESKESITSIAKLNSLSIPTVRRILKKQGVYNSSAN